MYTYIDTSSPRMSCLSRTHSAAVQLLVAWLITLAASHWQAAQAGADVVDRFPTIMNAFANTASGAAVRAVYEASQLTTSTSTGTVPAVPTPLQSAHYMLCQSDIALSSTDANIAALAKTWCSRYSLGGRLIAQTVNWSTRAAPGLQLLDQSASSYRARAWDCLTYACDTENTIVSASAATAPAALGGLGVSAPCCGTTNSTFVLYNTRGLVVQANMLPVRTLNREALQLAQAYATAQASSSASSSASAAELNLTVAMNYCLLRQLSPSFYGNSLEGTAQRGSGVGDGGIVVPVDVAICGEDLSDRIDTRHASLAITGYTAVLTTADGVDELAFPKELIEGVASWIARGADTATGSYDAANSLSRRRGLCAWYYNASYASAYRTGDYYDCSYAHTSLLAHLPPLLLTVRNESIVDTEDTNSSCSFAIDLTACAVRSEQVLRFFSTGSMMQELRLRQGAMISYRDPPIVVGMQHLRGATVAVTRAAYIAKWRNSGYNLATGLPLLYIATPRGSAVVTHPATTSSSSWYACVQPQSCKKRQIFYPSLNRCASKECVGVFLYRFDPDTFTCSVRVSVVSLFAAMGFTLLVAEATVLYLRRLTEQAKEEHMRLVHAVQRRDAGDAVE